MEKIFLDYNIYGDIVKTFEKYGKYKNGEWRPAIGFTRTIAMAYKISEIFQKSGYDFRVIHGKMNIEERNELIEKLKKKEIHGLISADLLTFGFNCPCVGYAFSCRHIKSRPLWWQIVGRILRKDEGKDDAVFIDHADAISEFTSVVSAIPILDPLHKWRIDGETKGQKELRIVSRNKEIKLLEALQKFDPIPCEMVEVKVEDTFRRLIKILENFAKKVSNLEEKIKEDFENETKNSDKIKELEFEKNNIKYEYDNASYEIKELKNKLKNEENKTDKNLYLITELRNKANNFQYELIISENKKEELIKKINLLKRKINTLEQENEIMKNYNKDEEIEKLQKLNEALTNENNEKDKKINKLKISMIESGNPFLQLIALQK